MICNKYHIYNTYNTMYIIFFIDYVYIINLLTYGIHYYNIIVVYTYLFKVLEMMYYHLYT